VIDRARREPDPFLDWKVRVFFAGAVLLAAGVVLGQDVLVLLAIAVLVVGLFATLILRKRQERARAMEAMEAEEGDDEDDLRDPPGGPHPLA
jgi:type III secretory pathway component EscV